jgi:hypothetical protein
MLQDTEILTYILMVELLCKIIILIELKVITVQ